GNDAQRSNLRQISDQRICHTVRKVFLRRIAGKVLQWQNYDRCDERRARETALSDENETHNCGNEQCRRNEERNPMSVKSSSWRRGALRWGRFDVIHLPHIRDKAIAAFRHCLNKLLPVITFTEGSAEH